MNQNLKSISGYLERREAKLQHLRTQAQRWLIMLISASGVGMITLSTVLLDQTKTGAMSSLQTAALSIAAVSFALAFFYSILGSGEFVLAPMDKAIIELDHTEAKRIERNLKIGGVSFIVGFGIVVGIIFGVMVTNVGNLLIF